MIKQRLIPFLLGALAAAMLACQPASAAQAKKPAAPAKPAQPAKPAAATATIAKDPYLGAIVVDAATGNVLFQDQPDVKGRPASALKLMDLLIILEQIEHGQLSMTSQVPVSARASHTGGSRVWLKEKESFTVDEMLYALMVQSANDVAVALAERSAGSVDGFVDLMNRRARELGMSNTVIHSPHGLPPGAGQLPDEMSPRDLSILCRELLKHPDALRYTATRQRTFRPAGAKGAIDMRNHDHLLASVSGCDGFKTGYYRQAGYTIALTGVRNGQRVIAVVMDSTTLKQRDAKATELINRGFIALQSQPGAPAAAVVGLPTAAAARNPNSISIPPLAAPPVPVAPAARTK